MKDDALTTCPKEKCGQKKWGKGKVKRQMGSGAGLIFKGSGFYITDYRSENYKAGAKKDSTASTPSSDAKPAATESKPAAPKTESKPAKAKTK